APLPGGARSVRTWGRGQAGGTSPFRRCGRRSSRLYRPTKLVLEPRHPPALHSRASMIHQFIFAGPKPGLEATAFQSYWVHFHAVEFAQRIRQIQQYLVATRLPISVGRDVPFFQGVAEIWLGNDDDQIASLQSPEFLDGARRDEPRWA